MTNKRNRPQKVLHMIHYDKQKIDNPTFVIGLDLDGTSGGFHKAFRDILVQHQGFAEDAIPVRAPKIYSYVDSGVFDCPKKFMRALHTATGQGVYRNLTPYRGFHTAIKSLVNDHGAAIKVITSRPDDALDDTIYWLEEVARIPYHEVNICHDKTQVMADIYVDDMPDHIYKIRETGRSAVTFHQVYNTDVPGPRLKFWKDAPELLKNSLPAMAV